MFVNNDLIYVQDGGTKVRALAWQQQENALWSPDISWEAEHLLQAGVTELAYTKRPHPQLYGIRPDGGKRGELTGSGPNRATAPKDWYATYVQGGRIDKTISTYMDQALRSVKL